MAESLWNTVDDYLKTQLLAHLGDGGDYATLTVQNAYIWAQTDPSEWNQIGTPFQVVMSYQSRAQAAGHDGSSTIKREQEYLATILSVVDGDAETATANAKTLAGRVEKLLASLSWAGVTATDGSKASRPKRGSRGAMFATQVELYPRPSNTLPGQKWGVAVTAFSVPGITV